MNNSTRPKFPGGSRERVNKAGNRIRAGNATIEDVSVVNIWREAHKHVINSFQAILRNRTRGKNIIVAQRHKRRSTIFDKLKRFPHMQLSRMDDVAGCRLIFETVDELNKFRTFFHQRSRFKHKLKNPPDKYNYLQSPKESGYRGIHDVYEYDVNSLTGRDRKGLLIELQYRTSRQHAWATTVELVGFLTEDQPKFGRGNEALVYILRLSSEIIARAFEGMRSSLPQMSDKDVVENFATLDSDLNFMQMLRGLNASDKYISEEKDIILIFKGGEGSIESTIDVRSFPNTTKALHALFELERDQPGTDIVLVRGGKPGDVREAFKNYFSDARQFINLVEEGCRLLLPNKVMNISMPREKSISKNNI